MTDTRIPPHNSDADLDINTDQPTDDFPPMDFGLMETSTLPAHDPSIPSKQPEDSNLNDSEPEPYQPAEEEEHQEEDEEASLEDHELDDESNHEDKPPRASSARRSTRLPERTRSVLVRYSPSPPRIKRRKSTRRCLKIGCNITNSRSFYKGPDGPGTLCYPCYVGYREGRVVVWYNERTCEVSIADKVGWTPMRVVGFEMKDTNQSIKDLNRPKLRRLTGTDEDRRLMESSKMVGVKDTSSATRQTGRKRARSNVGVQGGRSQVPKALADGLADEEGVFVKVVWKDDMRRFRMPAKVSFLRFREELRRVFQWSAQQLFMITFKDEAGDYVRVGDQKKMRVMLDTVDRAESECLKIRVIT